MSISPRTRSLLLAALAVAVLVAVAPVGLATVETGGDAGETQEVEIKEVPEWYLLCCHWASGTVAWTDPGSCIGLDVSPVGNPECCGYTWCCGNGGTCNRKRKCDCDGDKYDTEQECDDNCEPGGGGAGGACPPPVGSEGEASACCGGYGAEPNECQDTTWGGCCESAGFSLGGGSACYPEVCEFYSCDVDITTRPHRDNLCLNRDDFGLAQGGFTFEAQADFPGTVAGEPYTWTVEEGHQLVSPLTGTGKTFDLNALQSGGPVRLKVVYSPSGLFSCEDSYTFHIVGVDIVNAPPLVGTDEGDAVQFQDAAVYGPGLGTYVRTHHWSTAYGTLDPDSADITGQGTVFDATANQAGLVRVDTEFEIGSSQFPNPCDQDFTIFNVQGGITLADMLIVETIDQDDPTNADWEFHDVVPPGTHVASAPVYGGSEASTSDNLKLWVAVDDPQAVTNYTWSADAGGNADLQAVLGSPPSGPTAFLWDVGDIPDAIDAEVLFTVLVQKGRQSEIFEYTLEVGTRTDDTIVVGWINDLQVTLPPANLVNPSITNVLDEYGFVFDCLACNSLLAQFSLGNTNPGFTPLSPLDRQYALNWMFKYAANPLPILMIPGGDFRDPSGDYISDLEVALYQVITTNYKLFNRLQIRFTADQNGFKGEPVVLQQTTGIGSTPPPCGSCSPHLPTQTGPSDSQSQAHVFDDRVSLINDGSPPAPAIRAFNTLTAKDLFIPGVELKFWQNIGSKITFRHDGGTAAEIVNENYPTYYVYSNGTWVQNIQQAPEPWEHFFAAPYPFGTVPCGFPPQTFGTTPGGRCGDAESFPDPTAGFPEYIEP